MARAKYVIHFSILVYRPCETGLKKHRLYSFEKQIEILKRTFCLVMAISTRLYDRHCGIIYSHDQMETTIACSDILNFGYSY